MIFTEQTYHYKADAIFGRYLHNGHKVTNLVADQLYNAFEAERISDAEFRQVLAADLLWGGEERQTQEQLVLVVEASWPIEVRDIERAAENAIVLRRIGIKALGVVGGQEWPEISVDHARAKGIVTIINGYVDRDSWQVAWSRI